MNIHLYETLVFLHVLLAITWVGGGIAIQFFVYHMMKTDQSELGKFGVHLEWMGSKVFAPTAGVLVLIGIVMVTWGPPSWSAPFVIIGLIGWAATLVTGIVFLGPTAKKLGEAIQEKGPGDPEVVALRKRIMTVSRIDLAVLIIVVWAMVYKPGGFN